MPYLAYLVAALLVFAMPGASSADHRDGYNRDGYKNQTHAERRARLKRHEARERRAKRYRFGRHYYYYPYSRYWGPFAGPPGL